MDDEQIANRTDRGCLWLVLGAIALGVLAAWPISKGMGV